jgi:two-component system response regulator FlrC
MKHAPEPPPSVLVAEDDPDMRALLERILAEAGWRVTTAPDGEAALARLLAQPPDVLLTDVRMPGIDGIELLARARRAHPGLPVVVLTAFGTVPGAVDAMRLGAFDYLSKPLPDPATLREVMARARAHRGAPPVHRPEPEAPIHADPAFAAVLRLAQAVADRDTTVLLTGESGVGKEVVARYLHQHSGRRSGPFVALNCAAIAETLLEGELFGHERGAFTGAVAAHPGLFERASGGTLLLDEVAEMPPALQAKFLRVLETRRVQRLGGRAETAVDVRVVAATNRDVAAEVAAGRFREDLYFRLAVFPIHVPPLRERPGDILVLAQHFVEILGTSPGRTPPRLSREAEAALLAHAWPGNVRELRNRLERAVILASGEIGPADLGLSTGAVAGGPAAPAAARTLRDLERLAIEDALRESGGNRKRAAARLGIALRTLQYKLKEFGIT